MIKVVSQGTFKKNMLDQALAVYGELVEKTRLEAGCVSYELFQDTENSCILTMIETWEDRAALENHFKSEHFMRLVPKLKEMREGESRLNVYKKIL